MGILLKDRARAYLPQSVLETGSAVTDLRIVCYDGVVETFQAVFAWASSFMRRQLVAKFVMEDSGKRKDDVTLHLPEDSVEVVTALVHILVRGEITNLSGSMKRELQTLWKSLGIDRVEFEKLDMSNMKETKKVKNTRNVPKPPNPEQFTSFLMTLPRSSKPKAEIIANRKLTISKRLLKTPLKKPLLS
eukprot:TRINITY_DN34172_c0_g1_i1.p1 TRINITY_DN34172_c0_g1~~TRINITY_DN34172_c0_g1_i1.p1  ORF type:complete len:220 (+),score=52.44 TRINITY_DN34172_c0_g1_i1:95-661(+)